MSEELTALMIIGAAVLLFFLIRRRSELPSSRRPSDEPATSLQPPGTGAGENRVLITHPLIRRAAERAISKRSEAAKYLIKAGDQIYFSFELVPDPADREKAMHLMTRIQAGQDADMSELMWFLRRIFRE